MKTVAAGRLYDPLKNRILGTLQGIVPAVLLDFYFPCILILQHVVPVGYSELSVMRRNDAESVIVRPGCKFVGESKSAPITSLGPETK